MNVKAKRRALFRCDGGENIGLGHVVRCFALADVLAERGWDIRFAVSEQTAVLSLLTQSSFGVSPLVEQERLSSLIELLPADLVVVDHYGIESDYETGIKARGAQVLAIDDFPNRKHDADILLDATFGRRTEEYVSLTPATCRLLLGADYALLRRPFVRFRNMAKRDASADIHRVFVSFGGIDKAGVALKALRALDRSELDLDIDLAIGSASPHVAALQALAHSMRCKATIHVDSNDVAALLSQADLALGAAGTSSFERCALGIPSIIVMVSDNQKDLYRHLIKAGAAVGVGVPSAGLEDALVEAIAQLAADPGRRASIACNAADLCDAQGASRVADVIETLV